MSILVFAAGVVLHLKLCVTNILLSERREARTEDGRSRRDAQSADTDLP
jgi:hypothetical protein